MAFESYFQTNGKCLYLTHSKLHSDRPTILFIHGLGDSSLYYKDYLNSNLRENYNLLIPDLLGYGKSSASDDYSIAHQVQMLEEHILHLEKMHHLQFADLMLVSHSMGGIHATLFCEGRLKNKVRAFINVEGSITQYGSFMAQSMVQAMAENHFEEWWIQFKENKIYEDLGKTYHFLRPYYASLSFCHLQALKENAKQMIQLSQALSGEFTHVIGRQYAQLTIPKVYCYGDTMCKESLAFLQENKLAVKHFPAKTHFLLSECFADFVRFIDSFYREKV